VTINREYELLYGDEPVRHRPLVCWALAACRQARTEHCRRFGDYPHSVIVGPDVYDQLVREGIHYGWAPTVVRPGEWYVLGMRVILMP